MLTLCTLASLLLVLEQLDVVQLPGCGPLSACSAAATSRWGTLPGVRLPTSFLGLAYFEAMLVAWVWTRSRFSLLLRWIGRCGAVASLLLLTVLWAESHACLYCITVHSANLAWARMLGLSGGSSPVQNSEQFAGLASFVATFALTAILLGTFESESRAAKDELVEELVTESFLGCQSGDHNASEANRQPVGPGRYPLGLAGAKHHLVIVSDYQCPSCRTVHASIRRMAANRRDLTVSARHFPLCAECNSHVTVNHHANACRAACVAEAVGKLGGAHTFWQAHDWLFELRGEFSDEQLHSAARSWSLSPDELFAAMQSEEVTAAIQEDIEAAHQAGLQFTPMMFLDGDLIDGGRHDDL